MLLLRVDMDHEPLALVSFLGVCPYGLVVVGEHLSDGALLNERLELPIEPIDFALEIGDLLPH